MCKSKAVAVEYADISSIAITPATITVAAVGSVQIPAVVNGFGMCSDPNAPTQPSGGERYLSTALFDELR